MISLRKKQGTILISTYMVLFVVIVVASAFFTLIVTERKNVTRSNDAAKALNMAEKGVSYAYHESYNLGWQWYTHKWNDAGDKLLPLESGDQSYKIKTRSDCSFDGDGFYVHDKGDFMVKAYPDQTQSDTTVIVSKGACGQETRVITYYLSRQGIYDFFVYSPYNLDLYDALGRASKLNGGGVHSNGDIYIDSQMRIENVSEISTGAEGSIYYTATGYPAPYYADNYDGVKDGQAPISRLDDLQSMGGRDDSTLTPGPFGYYNSKDEWCWKDYAYYFTRDLVTDWPRYTYAYTDFDSHFVGDDQAKNNIAPYAKDPDSEFYNDSTPLNRYNVWVKPYQQDEKGELVDREWVEIPAKLDSPWEWGKYFGSKYGTGSAVGENPLEFYVTDNHGAQVSAEKSWWEIDASKEVVMLNPLDYPTMEDFKAAHPDAATYWEMFKKPDFWSAVNGTPGYANMLNDEVVSDGRYGTDRSSNNGNAMVNYTNSKKQPKAWKEFLSKNKLDNVLRDKNTGGEYLDTPEFSKTYSVLAKKDGTYIGLADNFDGEFSDYSEWESVIEDSVDAAVKRFNEAAGGEKVAEKVKFINAFTNKWNTVLELDLQKMQKTAVYPRNGIVYSQVPVRLTNAEVLPRAKEHYGFTVLSEENIYLKGDYNTGGANPCDWRTSAILSKKRVFLLSDDFNDPQVTPATYHYPDYPYMYVKEAERIFDFPWLPEPIVIKYWTDTNPDNDDGVWVNRDRLDTDGAVDDTDYYSEIPDSYERTLYNRINSKDSQYRSKFDKPDTTGAATDTFTWTYGDNSGESESFTYGMMANSVTQSQDYNCLIASNRWLDTRGAGCKGAALEYWGSKTQDLKGAYFVIQSDGFTAANNEFVDYYSESGMYYDDRDRIAPSTSYSGSYYLKSYYPSKFMEYDGRFKSASRSPSDVFFGGAESLWAEAECAFFYKMDF